MPGLLPHVDPDGLLEYSVVFSDRSLNHMSRPFQQAVRELSATLKSVYRAEAVAIVPGGGSFAMESVARQFAGGARCLVVRNGWFSYRWTQILDMGDFATGCHVLKARPTSEDVQAAWAPAPVEEVDACINDMRPDVVFAPHVETSAGIMLPDEYIRRVADAVHEVGGLMVLDCVASGAMWVDMQATGVDVLISAPQKGWSATPCAGLIMLSARALARLDQTTSSSFAMDLKKWLQIMQAYESGGHAYHATLPTDGLVRLRDAMRETEARGFEACRAQQAELGRRVRALLAERGFHSVAAAGFEAPGVVVSHTVDDGIHKGTKFAGAGLQTAAGVPLQCDEPAGFKTFRIGLFGLDKLADIDGTVARLAQALDRIGAA